MNILRAGTAHDHPSSSIPTGTPVQSDNGTTIFVKGFDKYLGEEEVRKQLTDAFSQYGTVNGVRLPSDRETGDLKGIGYIEFASAEEKEAACELNGQEAAGGWLKVDPNPGAPQRSGGGGGYGSGYGSGYESGGSFGGRGGRGGFKPRVSIDASGGGTGTKVTFD